MRQSVWMGAAREPVCSLLMPAAELPVSRQQRIREWYWNELSNASMFPLASDCCSYPVCLANIVSIGLERLDVGPADRPHRGLCRQHDLHKSRRRSIARSRHSGCPDRNETGTRGGSTPQHLPSRHRVV